MRLQLQYAVGSGILTNGTSDQLAAAAAVASWADLVVLTVGLGSLVEVESHDRSDLQLPLAQQVTSQGSGEWWEAFASLPGATGMGIS